MLMGWRIDWEAFQRCIDNPGVLFTGIGLGLLIATIFSAVWGRIVPPVCIYCYTKDDLV